MCFRPLPCPSASRPISAVDAAFARSRKLPCELEHSRGSHSTAVAGTGNWHTGPVTRHRVGLRDAS